MDVMPPPLKLRFMLYVFAVTIGIILSCNLCKTRELFSTDGPNRPCTMPFDNNTENRFIESDACPSVVPGTIDYVLFKSPFLFPSYIRQGTDRTSCQINTVGTNDCIDITPSISVPGISVSNDGMLSSKGCVVSYDTKFPFDSDHLESFANNTKRTNSVDSGTFIVAKQIHTFMVGGTPKMWAIPDQQYNALYNGDTFEMTLCMWVRVMQPYNKNWLHVFGTTSHDEEVLSKQQCPSIWIYPDQTRLQVRVSEVDGGKVDSQITLTHTSFQSSQLDKNWMHLSICISKPQNDGMYAIKSRLRVVDKAGGIVLDDKVVGMSNKIVCMNKERATYGLDPVSKYFSANFFSRRIDYRGARPGFHLYDVRVTHLALDDACTQVIFAQGLTKLRSSTTGNIPSVYVLRVETLNGRSATLSLDGRGMNSMFVENIKSINYICAPPKISYGIDNLPNLLPVSSVIGFHHEIVGNDCKLVLQKQNFIDFCVDKLNRTFVVIAVTDGSKFQQVHLSDAYLFNTGSLLLGV
jgi:hypothetical protein